MEGLILAATDEVEVYDPFSKCYALLYNVPREGIYDFPMSATYANSAGPSGAEHCTSCEIVSNKGKPAWKDQSRSSYDIFDVLDVTNIRMKERTMAALPAFKSLLSLSSQKEAPDLLLNGIYSQEESLITDWWHARGPGSFDIHEDVIVALFQFFCYCLTSSVLRHLFNKLKGGPKECFLRKLRSMPVVGHRRSLLKSFEPEKLGGTTLFMFDCAVLQGTAPEAVANASASDSLSTLDGPFSKARSLLHGLCNKLFYISTEAADGYRAVRARLTAADMQGTDMELLRMLKQLCITCGSWQQPKVHHLPKLLHRTLPLVEIGPSVCEVKLERCRSAVFKPCRVWAAAVKADCAACKSCPPTDKVWICGGVDE